MTALVALERLALSDTVVVPAAACGVEGSSIYLYAGEQITVETLLYALLLSSANDAAAALAYHTAGGIAEFAALMNQKAAELGLENTHFCNPHGLHDDAHYTTARDLACITAAALQNETFAKIVATKRYSAPQLGTDATRLFLNHNKLLRQFEGAIGVKTGFTKVSGRCLVSAARREGLTLIAVTLHDPNDWQDHAELINRAFSDYGVRKVVRAGDVLGTVEVLGGVKKKVKLIATEDFSYAMRDGEKCEFLVPGSGFVYAPIAENGEAGFVYVTIGGKAVGKVSVCYAMTIEQAKMPRKSFLKRLFGG
jgi:D-alanyl-D-alanine carboxypeptidase